MIGFDFETERIGGQRVIPPPICLAVAAAENVEDVRAHCEPEYDDLIRFLMESDEEIVAHNAAFDLAVICFHHPEHTEAVWRAICDDRRVHCTIIREKLLNLTTHGQLEFMPLPDGSNARVSYKLADLVQTYFNRDITEQKDANDNWRVNYAELRGEPVSAYPEEARQYVLDDARYAVGICMAQEDKRQAQIADTSIDPFEVEPFRVACDFALTLMTAWGIRTDPEEFQRVRAWLEEELKPENTALLVEAGILRPAIESRPYKNGATNPDGTPKMTAAKAESIDTKKMRSHMVALKEAYPDDVVLRRTKPSDRHPKGQLSFDSEWLDDHFHLCPIIEQYRNRQALQKLVTTELPRMMELDADGNRTDTLAPVVHPCFDVLKRTGRTSSFAGGLFPSFNCQNVHPRARGCYVARPGTVLLSVDYSQMELGTLAQTCVKLFGKSVMADKINDGVDLHAYLGGSIAYNSSDEFRGVCDKEGVANTGDIYQVFQGLKTSKHEQVRKFYSHYRTLAKPTGLGYPGGLGPATFVKYAKATYGVVIDYETAEKLRNVWMAVFPEMERYFAFINYDCEDTRNSPRRIVYRDEEGEQQERLITVYAYCTPFGMYRAGCDYCAAANGLGLQSPSAEGALLAVLNVARACYDPSMESILYDDALGPVCRPVAFIHDELLLEIRDDSVEEVNQRVTEVRDIMVDAMRVITPDVAARTTATLMRRWSKEATPTLDKGGNLVCFEDQSGEYEESALQAAS